MRRNERLRYTRILYGLTQTEVATELGCKRNYISMVENGNDMSEEKYAEIMNAIYKVGEEKKRKLKNKLESK